MRINSGRNGGRQVVAKWNPLALKILLWVMGVLLVVGSAASFVGNAIFDFGSGAGVTAPVAGIAFGAGMMIAGFDPIANISWVRALVVYAILEIVFQVFTQITIGTFDIVSFIIAILAAGLVLVLYPNKPPLWMQGGRSSGARASANHRGFLKGPPRGPFFLCVPSHLAWEAQG